MHKIFGSLLGALTVAIVVVALSASAQAGVGSWTDFSVATNEPGTLALVGIGLLGLVRFARKNRSQG